MTQRSFPILSYNDIQKINWFVADTVRDKGNTESSQYKLIALPFLTLKRLLDMREEYKKKEIYTSPEYEFEDNNLEKALLSKMSRHPAYAVLNEKLAWYDIEWTDIVQYKDNPDRNVITYKLGNEEKRCSIETNAIDKIEFMFEVVKSFGNNKINRYFNTTDFEEVCKKLMPAHAMLEIINELDKYNVDLEHAEEDLFADAYMDLTARFAEMEGKKGGEFHTPSDLVKACIELMPPEVKDNKSIKIGDITSGACTFMTYAAKNIEEKSNINGNEKKDFVNKNIEFITQEKNKYAIGLGDMNVLFHGYENHKSFEGNTITDWKNGFIGDYEGKLDYIYANPPYGLKDYGFEYAKNNISKENRWKLGLPNKSEGEYAFILSILNLLNDNGKALIVLPLGTLFKESTQEIRKKIIENDWLEGIIGLPDKMFLTTSIPVCLWLINKNKKEENKNKIFIIDASNDFKKIGKFNKWNKDKSIQTYLLKNIEEGFSKYVEKDLIEKSNYNLSINKYIIQKNNVVDININELNSEIKEIINELYLNNFMGDNK